MNAVTRLREVIQDAQLLAVMGGWSSIPLDPFPEPSEFDIGEYKL